MYVQEESTTMGPRSVVSITSRRLSPSMPTKYFTS